MLGSDLVTQNLPKEANLPSLQIPFLFTILNYMVCIQNNIRFYRKQKGLTQWDVALYLGFNIIGRISKWEHGKQFPHVKNLLQMAVLIGIHAEELYSQNESVVQSSSIGIGTS